MTSNEQARYAFDLARFRKRLEQKAYRLTRQTLLGLLRSVTTSLATMRPDDWSALPEQSVPASTFRGLLTDIYTAVGPETAKREFELVRSRLKVALKRSNPLFGLSFFEHKWRQLVVTLLSNADSVDRIRKMTDTTRSQIQAVIQDAVGKGLTVEQTARLLEKRLGGKVLNSRALLIARTETTRAMNEAADMGATTAGIKLQKTWVPIVDSLTRPSHLVMKGKPPIPYESKFTVGGKQMKYPGDPAGGAAECINCRCSVTYSPLLVNGMPVSTTTSFFGRIGRSISQAIGNPAISDLFKSEDVQIE